jgi:CBS domain-containing protein
VEVRRSDAARGPTTPSADFTAPLMKLADLLLDDWIAIPMQAPDLESALRVLLTRLQGTGPGGAGDVDRLAADLAGQDAGEIVRVNPEVVLVLGRLESLEGMSVTLGVSASPFRVDEDGGAGTARAVLLLLTPRGMQTVRAEVVPTLVRVLRDEERTRRLLAADSVVEVRALRELMDAELRERYLVGDACIPARYRVAPDTPLLEVVDLMVRRELRAIPVVGERREVLGLITVGDALAELLPKSRGGTAAAEADRPGTMLRARDVMTRSVLCVSEDQPLMDAASMMVNRGVDQLPVVREGQLVGVLTRDAILRLLFTGDVRGTQGHS